MALFTKQGLQRDRMPADQIMPDFIIIGAQRCGTTSLYKYLTKHPSVARGLLKEVHFFDLHFRKGIPWYRSQFPSLFHKRAFIAGEASPYYIFHPHAPRRIFETIPQAKLIALLRNPVDRALSHYYHEVANGVEPLSFEDAIDREGERLDGEMEKLLEDEDYQSFNHRHFSYLLRGIYVDQLKVWMDLFSKEQLLILRSEDMLSDPSATTKRVSDFLGLPGWEPNTFKKYNARAYPKMDPNTRKRLIEYFEPHNQRLYEYLGVNLGWD